MVCPGGHVRILPTADDGFDIHHAIPPRWHDGVTVQSPSIVLHEPLIVLHDESIVLHEPLIVLHDESIVLHEPLIVLHDESIVLHELLMVLQSALMVLHPWVRPGRRPTTTPSPGAWRRTDYPPWRLSRGSSTPG